MGTTSQKLQKLADTKAGLGAALTTMGRTVPTQFSEYAAEFSAEDAAFANAFAGTVDASLTTPFTIPARAAAKIITIKPNAFQNTAIAEVNFPNCTGFGGTSTFRGCTKLTTVSLPKATGTTDNLAFEGCTALTTFSAPKLTALYSNCFRGCTKLQYMTLDSLETMGTCFGSSYSDSYKNIMLGELYLPAIQSISAYTFGRSASQRFTPNLRNLYITNKTIAEVKAMANYSTWNLNTNCIIHCSDGNFNYGS